MLSKYNEYITIEDSTYIYNHLSTALVEIDKAILLALKDNKLDAIDSSLMETMKNLHLWVNDGIDESQEYFFHYNNYRFGDAGRTLSIMFVPTYSCNLACSYCLQGQNKEIGVISIEKTDIILKFIEGSITQSYKNGVQIDTIFIHLFGGEPLAAKKQVCYFCNHVSKLAQKYGCTFKCDMTTNLTLLDDDIIALIKKYRIFTQVTIDGPKHVHDVKRVDKLGHGTYDRIINNINKLVENGLKDILTIRVNIDTEALSTLDQIMNDLNPLANDIYFAFITPYRGFNDKYNSCVETCKFANILDEQFVKVYEKYRKFIPKFFGRQSPCSLNSINKYVIDLNLDVYKCEILISCKEMAVGTLSKNGELIVNDNYYKQMQYSPENSEKCRKCNLLPLCAGGCAGKRYINQVNKDRDLPIICDYKQQQMDFRTHLLNYIKRIKQSQSVE